MEKGDYTISDIYQGGYSSLKPNYGDIFTGYRVDARNLGMSTDARTANVLKEVSENLSAGAKTVELTQVSPEVFDAIPKDQLKEINRLSKLVGADVSVHAPIMEPSGISQQGFSNIEREATERQMNSAVERSHEISPDGNVPVTFHSSAIIPSTQYKMTPEGKKIERLIVINQETGKMAPIEEEAKHYPGIIELEKGKIYTPKEELDALNNTEWINSITNLEFYKKEADEAMQGALIPLAPLLTESEQGKPIEITTPQQKAAMNQLQRAEIFLNNVETSFNSLYNKAYKYSDEKSKEKLKEISDEWVKNIEEIKKQGNELNYPILKSQLLDHAIEKIRMVAPPKGYVPVEDFAIKHSSETFGNVAFNSYKKFGEKAPIISIENPPAGGGLSTGEDLKKLVEVSREKFVEKAVQEGMSESQAKLQAEKLLGVTWDVGHINMLRKQGYEEKDIIKETEKIAPLVKHVHLSDNFGFEHTELPMGMGNVPIKEIMEKLGKEGYKGKKIIEAMSWWQHFSPGGKQNPPLKPTLEAMGSPIYAIDMAPYWNQTPGFQQGYFSGYGQMLPPQNYQTWGSGFSMASLPIELGGQMPGAQGSRMSGKPME